MNMIDNALGVHAQALGLRSKRMEVLSRNIANADTPHFKAKDVDFASVLKQSREASLNTTNNLHLSIPMDENPGGEKYRVPFNASFDGNTVEMNVEQAKFGQVAADYQATLNILENRVSGIRRALRGD
ncbi:MAG: Flagellar basal body rod protein FlgB [Pseudomonadota bacterium]|jgi:flagellar basal-body rod protein FlgB